MQVNAALCEDATPNPAFTCVGGTYVWNAGKYGKLKATQGSHVFNPGIYAINGGPLAFTTDGSITGTGVGFYGYGNWDGISITSQGTVDFSAPTSGPMKGILIWVARTIPTKPMKKVKFEGGVDSQWKGTIYAPSQHVDFGGHSNSDGDWVYIIADNIDVHGQGAVTQLHGPTSDTPGAPDVFKATLVE